MNPTATVTRDAEGDLNREVWVFELWGDASVYLRSYTKDSRKTKRHKWRPEEGYFRLQTDRNSPVRKLPHPEVPKGRTAEEVLQTLEAEKHRTVTRGRIRRQGVDENTRRRRNNQKVRLEIRRCWPDAEVIPGTGWCGPEWQKAEAYWKEHAL